MQPEPSYQYHLLRPRRWWNPFCCEEGQRWNDRLVFHGWRWQFYWLRWSWRSLKIRFKNGTLDVCETVLAASIYKRHSQFDPQLESGQQLTMRAQLHHHLITNLKFALPSMSVYNLFHSGLWFQQHSSNKANTASCWPSISSTASILEVLAIYWGKLGGFLSKVILNADNAFCRGFQ